MRIHTIYICLLGEPEKEKRREEEDIFIIFDSYYYYKTTYNKKKTPKNNSSYLICRGILVSTRICRLIRRPDSNTTHNTRILAEVMRVAIRIRASRRLIRPQPCHRLRFDCHPSKRMLKVINNKLNRILFHLSLEIFSTF